MATLGDETTKSPPETPAKKILASLVQVANLLQDQTNTIEQYLSSRQNVEHLLLQLVDFDKLLRESLKLALKALTMDDMEMMQFRKILRRSRKLKERVSGMNRNARMGGNLLEGLLACEDLRRRVLGDVFCQDFEALSLSVQGCGDETEAKIGEN
jgi:hypothetical protein